MKIKDIAPYWFYFAIALFAAILFWRAGFFPAAMTGDEIWFSESAYQWIEQGHPARSIHQDAVGSATRDYLPPVITAIQAVGFLLFGLTPFAVGLQSAVVPLLTVLLVYRLARMRGAMPNRAALAAVAVLGAQTYLASGLYIRYEALSILFFLLFMALRPTGFWVNVVRGASLCLAGLSYYPLAPFLGLAALVFELAEWRHDRHLVRRLTGLAAGFTPPALAFAWHVAAAPDLFAAQILGNGAANYGGFDLLRGLFSPGFWRGNLRALPELLGIIGLLGFATSQWRTLFPRQKALVLIGWVLLMPAFVYPFHPRLLGPSMVVVLAIVPGLWVAGRPGRALSLAVPSLGAVAALTMAVILSMTMVVQGRARNALVLDVQIARLLRQPGAVAIDQRAWLAVRRTQPTREIHHAMPDWAAPQVRIFESRVLQDPAEAGRFRYAILSTENARKVIDQTPALKAAFEAGTLVELVKIRPRFDPLPWASSAPYDLMVYGPPNQQ